MNTWTNEEDIVYDPFMESSITAKVAGLLGRKWLGSELSEAYVAIAQVRIGEHLG